MKKLLGIVVLGLFWCNPAFSEKFILECYTDYRVTKEGKKPLEKLYSKYLFDLKKKTQSSMDSRNINYFIYTDEAFLQYNSGPALGGGFYIQTIIWDRLNGRRIIRTARPSVEKYKKIKKEFDKINSKIKNYKKDLSWGDETYAVSDLGTFDQEMEKYNISNKNVNKNEYVIWQCEKTEKAF